MSGPVQAGATLVFSEKGRVQVQTEVALMRHEIPLCDATEVALKSFFLGPQSENADWLVDRFRELFRGWFRWRRQAFHEDGLAISSQDQKSPEFIECQQRVVASLEELTRRFEKELPKYSPRYVGHMLSEVSMPALLGHVLTLLHNPNIIAREAAFVATDIENEAIDSLARMMGFPHAYGHFTSGGTVANFEAVVRASARLHAWMAKGAVNGFSSLFEAAHMGWQRYSQLEAKEEQLWPFLPERSDPWEAVRNLEGAYGVTFRGPVLIVPRSAHYSWKKAARIFGVGEASLRYVDSDIHGRYRVDELERHLRLCQQQQQAVVAVVSVAGTTETGAIDPIDQIQDLLDGFREKQGIHIWHHVDAAYGGFFCSLLRPAGPFQGAPEEKLTDVLAPPIWEALAAVSRVDSVSIDPHKLGYVPYSSGTFMVTHQEDYTCVQTLAPYLDYVEGSDRGPYTLEGSRSAAGAVATWLTARSIGLDQSGYGLLLARTIRQKRKLENFLREKMSSAHVTPGCDTNLLCFCVADPGEAVSQTNQRTLRILHRLMDDSLYFLSKTAFPIYPGGCMDRFIGGWQGRVDVPQLLVLRLSLMNPFFDSSELDVNHIEHLVFALGEVAD